VQNIDVKRRDFLTRSALALLGVTTRGDAAHSTGSGQAAEPALGEPAFSKATADGPIIDIHQHLGYSGRPDDVLLAHQRAIGATTTILLPAGRLATGPSTHGGLANGLQAEALGNEACDQFVQAHRQAFLFGANDVPDLEGATREIERYLKRGAVVIAEQKFGVECDSAEMQKIYALARAYDVPVLMHWQFKMYNYGFERFHKMLEKFPRVKFLGHAQTWWANIDRNHTDQTVLYPKGPVTFGGLTDRYLSDYSNMYGDLSAGSGLNALTRDENFTRDFLTRHRDKLLFGSDCNDRDGGGPNCLGAQIIASIRRLAANRQIERKLLYENAKRLFRL
jgi:predicted TIM-barrel fold metal-dependent hydrolase